MIPIRNSAASTQSYFRIMAASPHANPRQQAQTLTNFMNRSSSRAIGVLFGCILAVSPAMWPITVLSPQANTIPKIKIEIIGLKKKRFPKSASEINYLWQLLLLHWLKKMPRFLFPIKFHSYIRLSEVAVPIRQ